jgi:putative chitinase
VTDGLVQYLPEYLEKYNLNTELELAHFLAQAAHESAYFRTLTEYASGSAYEGRRDLGNVYPGDGRRYKGRGIFQLTGRSNYAQMSKKLGVDLVNNPGLAATPEISVQTALEYWKSRNLSKWAKEDNVEMVTKLINGGYNGLKERRIHLQKAKRALALLNAKVKVPDPRPTVEPVIVVEKPKSFVGPLPTFVKLDLESQNESS